MKRPVIEPQSLAKLCNEALLLACLERGPRHGYQIALDIEERGGGFFRFNHGTLYPILHKLEKDGLIKGSWSDEEGGRGGPGGPQAEELHADGQRSALLGRPTGRVARVHRAFRGRGGGGEAMTDFADVLGPLSARLPLPQPARSRMLLEVAADLEAAYEHYREEGLTEEEARRQAVEAFDLSEAALADLVRVHTSFSRRLLDRLSIQAQMRWERSLLLILAGTLTFVGAQLAVRDRIVADAGAFVWPVLVCGAAGLILGAVKFYQIYVKEDHEVRRAHRGLDAVAALAGAQVVLGMFGAWFELYLTAERIAQDVNLTLFHLFNWLMSSAALLSVGLTGALLTAMLWFAVASRVARIDDAEAALLLASRGE